MLHTVKKLIPKPLLKVYHYILARIAPVIFGNPSSKIIVIGVTGTNGKSSTVQFISQLLSGLGEKVGYTTTAGFMIAGEEIENKMKMTMPGRFYLQSLLRKMVNSGCKYAILETSSEGIAQFRHLSVNYDVTVFTNLTPEHIESHGSFDSYKRAKGKLFSHLTERSRKKISGKRIPKTSVMNADDEFSDYFIRFKADDHILFSFKRKDVDILAKTTKEKKGAKFTIDGEKFDIPLLAEYQQKNALAAIATVSALGFTLEEISEVTGSLAGIPGRFQFIDMGQPFSVIVDYAYEPYALEALFESVQKLKPKRIIGVHGSAGGGRDVARRYDIGKLAAEMEDIVVVTNEDPYDEDPRTIIEEVAKGAIQNGKIEGKSVFLIDDRGSAIERAIFEAKKGDVVILTGKGSEPVMAVAGGKKVPWSDPEQARRILVKLGYGKDIR